MSNDFIKTKTYMGVNPVLPTTSPLVIYDVKFLFWRCESEICYGLQLSAMSTQILIVEQHTDYVNSIIQYTIRYAFNKLLLHIILMF